MKKPKFITDDNKIRWHSDEAINREWRLGRLKINLRMTSGNGVMGRLGGGWAWKLGMMGSGSEVCMEIVFFTLRFRWMPNTIGVFSPNVSGQGGHAGQ
jgi:hypothetical protein